MVFSFGIAVISFLLPIQPALALIPDTSPNNIFARQLSGLDPNSLPSSCVESNCQAFVGDACSTLSCLCTTTYANDFTTCYQCLVSAGEITQDAVNQILSGLYQDCSDGGSPIAGAPASDGSSGSSGTGTANTATGTANTATGTATATATGSGNTGSTGSGAKLNAGSKINVGTFGIMVTTALAAITLL